MADNFSVWVGRPRYFYKRDLRNRQGWVYEDIPSDDDFKPRSVAKGFKEPAEAADVAEDYLKRFGIPGRTWAELRFNGDKAAHTTICYLDGDMFGVFNEPKAPWPIFYPEDVAEMMEGIPDAFFGRAEGDNGTEGTPEDENSDGFGDTDPDSKLMDLGGEMEKADTESPDESEEFPVEDDEDEEELDDDDDDFTDEDDEPDDEPEDEDDAEDGDEPDPDKDEGDPAPDDEGENESESDEDDESETEDEMELPRLKLFAKLRGPLGWRKRAELEELNDRNVFAMKVGVLPDEDEMEGLTRAQQERNTFVQVEFIERDENRQFGVLRMRLPDDVTLDDFTQQGSGWIVAKVPLPRDDS